MGVVLGGEAASGYDQSTLCAQNSQRIHQKLKIKISGPLKEQQILYSRGNSFNLKSFF